MSKDDSKSGFGGLFRSGKDKDRRQPMPEDDPQWPEAKPPEQDDRRVFGGEYGKGEEPVKHGGGSIDLFTESIDLLADRKTKPEPPLYGQPFPEDRVYTAHVVRRQPRRLQIIRAGQPARYPSYHYLQDIKDDVFTSTAFLLIYPGHMQVEVKGQHLRPIIHAIAA